MTNRDRIVNYLQAHPEGIDDDDLARVLKLSYRQEANKYCRELEAEGIITRRHYKGKIHNFWIGSKASMDRPSTAVIEISESPKIDDWFWEGNVQEKVIQFLVELGYTIVSSADTESHQTGVDVIAIKYSRELWISVKGYPHGTTKTNPTNQAGHYFKDAIFDIINYRERDKNIDLAVAFPDFNRYHKLADKITWFKAAACYKYFWVTDSGAVSIE